MSYTEHICSIHGFGALGDSCPACTDRTGPGTTHAQAKRVAPNNCTASVDCTHGLIVTKSCVTGRPLIDRGESSDGERDFYECPDCGKNITIDYREN